ncbi:ABC transporter ATP-binding protein [Staphylococcus caeli]|uniref:ABC transporter ATP-binding protein n=1 Tax=Staphylococcus caeli TaxID=2201815 RepID=UPI003F5793A6
MIKINHLTKTYNRKQVVDNATFSILEGKCTALIGPNGAGKSTLIDMIIGDRHPTSGNIQDEQGLLQSQNLGIMFQKTNFPDLIKVKELYQLFANLYKDTISLERFCMITRFDDNQLNQYANKLSGGQKRILDFALSLIGKPQCVFLDEPTSAMDVQMRKHFWNIVTELKNEGVTLFYTSHYIEEVERMADHVIVLEKGKVILNDKPETIKDRQQTSIIYLPSKYQAVVDSAEELAYTSENNKLRISTDNVQAIIETFIAHQIDLNEIEITKASLLETIFTDNDTEGMK